MTKRIRQRRHPGSARRTLAGIALGLLWLVSAPGAARAQFAFTTIDVPDSSATYANGNGVRRIVGEYEDEDGTHGFVPLSAARFDQARCRVNPLSRARWLSRVRRPQGSTGSAP